MMMMVMTTMMMISAKYEISDRSVRVGRSWCGLVENCRNDDVRALFETPNRTEPESAEWREIMCIRLMIKWKCNS